MSYKPWEQTAQLQFKNCLNFSQNEQVRGGCRGGRDQFSWDALRTMKYNDRIHYLGQTVVIGYLDKGGKWRKRDWYTKVTEDDKKRIYDGQSITDEMKQIQDEDNRRIRVAMGLDKPGDGKDAQKAPLTKEEMAELTKKAGPATIYDEEEPEHKGLGLEKKGVGKLVLNTNPQGQTVLEAYGLQDEYKKTSSSEKATASEQVVGAQPTTKKIKKDKTEKKQKKAAKKELKKQEKKDRKEKRAAKKTSKRKDSSDSD